MKRKAAGTVFVFSVLVLISGCASYQPRPLSPVDTTKAFEARTLDNPGLREFIQQNLKREVTPWPPVPWDLATLTLAALYYHPDMDVARARWGVAEAGVITAGGRPNPRLSAVPEYDTNPAQGVSPWILTFSLEVPVETAGKRGYRIARARRFSEAARLNIATTAWKIKSRLRTRLLDLFDAERTEEILRNKSEDLEKLVKAEEQLFKAGEVSRFEVTQARIAADETSLLLREAQKRRAEAQARLAGALGVPQGALDGTALSFGAFNNFPPASALSPGDLRQRALTNRTDILGALEEYAASESALQLEIARQYPDVSIGPGYSWDQGENKWSIGISLSLPLLNRNRGPIAEAEARRKEREARFVSLQAEVIGEVERSLAAYGAAQQKLDTADALLEARKRYLQSVLDLLQAGEVGRPALLSARLEFFSAELARSQALVEVQQSLGFLEDAVQRPFGPADERQAVPGAVQGKEGNNQ